MSATIGDNYCTYAVLTYSEHATTKDEILLTKKINFYVYDKVII